jgi:hypothetical protein
MELLDKPLPRPVRDYHIPLPDRSLNPDGSLPLLSKMILSLSTFTGMAYIEIRSRTLQNHFGTKRKLFRMLNRGLIPGFLFGIILNPIECKLWSLVHDQVAFWQGGIRNESITK